MPPGVEEGRLTAEWRLLLEGDEETLRVLNISTAPDNQGYVRAEAGQGVLMATSPPMHWRSSLSALQDYLSHLKLSLKVLLVEEGLSSSGEDSG